MGYTTIFSGTFQINKPLDDETFQLIKEIATTRRMKRDETKLKNLYGKNFGTEGEFFVDGKGSFGQESDETVLNNNAPPRTQPGLWCQWTVENDRKTITWDGGEKFYQADAWINYLIEAILKPRGYIVNGSVNALGDDPEDQWSIFAVDNELFTKLGWLEGTSQPDSDNYFKEMMEEYKKLLKQQGIDTNDLFS